MNYFFTGNNCLVVPGSFSIQRTPEGFIGTVGSTPFTIVIGQEAVTLGWSGNTKTYPKFDQEAPLPQAIAKFPVTQFEGSYVPGSTAPLPTYGGNTLSTEYEGFVKYLLANVGAVMVMEMTAGPVSTAASGGASKWCKEYKRQLTMWTQAFWCAMLWYALYGCGLGSSSEICIQQLCHIELCREEMDELVSKMVDVCGGAPIGPERS